MAFAAFTTLGLAACGAIAVPTVERLGLKYYSLFYEQYARIEPAGLAIVALFAIATLVLLATSRGIDRSGPLSVAPAAPVRFRPWAWVLAGAAFLVVLVGTDVVFHSFLLADDEYSAWFQAVIFAHGRWSATVAPEWCRWIGNLTPTSIGTPQACTWHLGFFPIHSMIRAAFMAVGAGRLAGPLTAGISIVLVGAIAERLWPDRPHRAWVAMLALASSTQLLFMSMTMFSMPTHLLFALVWLWLYVMDRRWSVVALPWVGVVALGIHSPLPHLLLIPVFVLRYVREKRYWTFAYIAVVYLVGLVWWRDRLAVWSGAGSTIAGSGTAVAQAAGSILRVPDLIGVYSQTMSVTLIATWNMPVLLLCVMAAGLAWSRLDRFSRDAVLSLLLTVLVRSFMFPYMHGEGWGYRYIYSGLGLLALLTAVGSEVLADALGRRRTVALFTAALVCSVVVQLPMRAVQTRQIIEPYYRASVLFAQQKEKIVAFHAADFLWARQLVRNDPFLRQGPLIMDLGPSTDSRVPPACAEHVEGSSAVRPAPGTAADRLIAGVCAILRLSPPGPEVELMKRYPGQVRIVTDDELAAVGLTRFSSRYRAAGRDALRP